MEPTLYFDYLINIGNSNQLPDDRELIRNVLSRRFALPTSWVCLKDEELIPFFKGLVILEEYWFSHGEHIGSTTDTKFVYNEIHNRGLDDSYALANWAFQLSSNPFVPLDSGNRHGAKTVYELFEWEKAYKERLQKEKEDSFRLKEEKKRLKAEAHAERLRIKEQRDKELGYKK
jgi:hypothetical protein